LAQVAAGMAQFVPSDVIRKPAAKPMARSRLGPGDVVKSVLHRLGYSASNCGCAAMQAEMNALGWMGCISDRKRIIDWFVAKAAERSIRVERSSVWGLLVAAWKDRGHEVSTDVGESP